MSGSTCKMFENDNNLNIIFYLLRNCWKVIDLTNIGLLIKVHNEQKAHGKGPFTNTCKGGLMQNIFIAQFFCPPPLRPHQISGPPFAMKSSGQPNRKAWELNFYWKICGIFQPPSLQGSQILRAPFCIRSPHQCFWTISNDHVILSKILL